LMPGTTRMTKVPNEMRVKARIKIS